MTAQVLGSQPVTEQPPESSEGNDSPGGGCSSIGNLRDRIPERNMAGWGCRDSHRVEELICATARKRKHDQPQHQVVVAYRLTHLDTLGTPWTVACLAPLNMGFSRQGY